jgi:predicted DNA binding CopG/RHH family protein
MSNKQKQFLDEEEQEILEFFEQDIRKVDASEFVANEKNKAAVASKNFLTKSERINIRMNAFDLNHIKRKAAQEGMPYQTLISSILHKYASRSIS